MGFEGFLLQKPLARGQSNTKFLPFRLDYIAYRASSTLAIAGCSLPLQDVSSSEQQQLQQQYCAQLFGRVGVPAQAQAESEGELLNPPPANTIVRIAARSLAKRILL